MQQNWLTQVHLEKRPLKFITHPTCQFASESGVLRWCQNNYTLQDLKGSVLRRFLNVKNVSAEQVWTSREFQTVGVATQNALDANAMVAGGCCNSRADWWHHKLLQWVDEH